MRHVRKFLALFAFAAYLSAAPDSSWERWTRQDLGGFAAAQVLRLDGSIIAVTHGALFRLDPQARKWVELPASRRSYDAAMPFGRDLLTSSRELGLARLDAEGRVLEIPRNPFATTKEFRQIVRDGAGRIWAANKRALVRVDGTAGALRLEIVLLPESVRCDPCEPGKTGPEARRPAQAVDIEIDDQGLPWVGYGAGLTWLEGGRVWRHIRAAPPVSDVRSFALVGNTIWLAGRNSDEFFRLEKRGEEWITSSFTPAEGYGPAATFFLNRDSRGWIWRGSTEGVHIADGSHLRPEDWLHLNDANGLACGEADNYGFFEDDDQSVWIAGSQGITHLMPDAGWFDAPAGSPAVKNLQDPGAGIFRFQVEGAPLARFREYPFRARISKREWKISRDGHFEFDGLRNGTYSLEVAYTGNASSVRAIPVRVGPAPFPTAWLAAISAVLAIVVLLVRLLLGAERFERVQYAWQKLRFALRWHLSGASVAAGVEDGSAFSDLTGRTLLNRYAVQRVVAHGGFSMIYAAADRVTGERLAIKQLRAANGQLRERFMREVAMLRSIDHPNVVRVLDSWIEPAGQACLAMPFLNGPTLREEMKNGPLDTTRAALIVRGIGSALTGMHARGIVHRDIKPENVILIKRSESDCAPILIDFGIATIRERAYRINFTLTMAGSFQYMAPECLTGHYSTATDVYSLSVMTLEMLTLKRLGDFETPFHDPRFADMVRAALRDAVGDERAVALAQILTMAYDPSPANRPEAGDWTRRVCDLLEPA